LTGKNKRPKRITCVPTVGRQTAVRFIQTDHRCRLIQVNCRIFVAGRHNPAPVSSVRPTAAADVIAVGENRCLPANPPAKNYETLGQLKTAVVESRALQL
jgi:hypothetical protein